MNSRLVCLVAALLLVSVSSTWGQSVTYALSPSAWAASETKLVSAIHDAALAHDWATMAAGLTATPSPEWPVSSSLAMLRRAAQVSATLRDENHYPEAVAVAKRAIALLRATPEPDQSAQVERLYWEAVLEGEILGDYRTAAALVQSARQLAPNDRRLGDFEQRIGTRRNGHGN